MAGFAGILRNRAFLYIYTLKFVTGYESMKKTINRITAAIVILLFAALNTTAQEALRTFIGARLLTSEAEIAVSDGTYRIYPYNERTCHTIFYPLGDKLPAFSFARSPEAEPAEFTIRESDEKITLSMGAFEVRITKEPFTLAYYFDHTLLIKENRGYNAQGENQILNFRIEPDEVLYGSGARAPGLNRRGSRLELYNRAHYGYETESALMNYTLPLFLSSKRYAVLFDNAGHGFLDLDSGSSNEVTYECLKSQPNYYVIAGTDWYDLTDNYTRLTGRQSMLPRWALGNFSSRFGYHSQKETKRTVKRFFREKIPLDAVIIDIYWFGKEIQGSMGNLTWHADSFPNPERMMKRFMRKGVRTILVTEPFILTTSTRWNEAVKKRVLGTDSLGKPYTYDFYFGNTGLIDIFNPMAREWFWQIYKGLAKQGVAGWWGDLGEPEVHPAGLRHMAGTAGQVHNAYGHEWARLIFEGYRRDFPHERPFILMRAGYAGSQRYGMIPWSGDVNRSWGGLKSQPAIALQMGMQGLAWMHSDLGGFAGGDTIDNELYTRWLQYGIFQPIFRPHAQEHIPAEPVFQEETTKVRARKAIELRYMLIPYIYTMAFENNQTGKPLMVPLLFDEPGNAKLLTYDSAYRWGPSFLVSPVLNPGQQIQRVYFPEGSGWTHFFTGEQYSGGSSAGILLNPDHIPVFVKDGAFVPMLNKAVSTRKYSLKKFTVHYYAGNTRLQSSYALYNDDGITPESYPHGEYEILEFESADDGSRLRIQMQQSIAKGRYDGEIKKIALVIHNLDAPPSGVMLNGRQLKPEQYRWDSASKKLEVRVKCGKDNSVVEIIR